MKIYLATDHAGFELKEKIKAYLSEKDYDTEDLGAYSFDPQDDYPDFIAKVGLEISRNTKARGIVFGGSGEGEAMVANKFPGVRAALFYAPRIPPHPTDVNGRKSEDPYELLRLTREHNNANVLSLGARLLSDEEAFRAVDVFLETGFPQDARHVRRINKINMIEKELK